MKLELWAADDFCFTVEGADVHEFLNRAATAGVRLRHVRRTKTGCTAQAGGIDRRRLESIAHAGGWTLTALSRRGPGKPAERLLRCRPGLAAGAVLFCLLLRFWGGFVWCVDLGAMDAALQPALRALLADCGIHEGTRLTKPLLQAAQAQALRRSETFGWVSLNFTGGCLSIESTPTQTQTVRDAPPTQGLYAKADGQILAVEIERGFPAVQVGDTVIAGQELAAAVRYDRKGNPVPQGAQGVILARVEKQYTVRQPLEAEVLLYTGRSAVRKTLYLPGFARTTEPDDELVGEAQTEWLPLRIGRVALPACVCRTTTWERISRPLIYKEETAAAIALRTCRAALLREFPDAVIEAERREISAQNGKKTAVVIYVFTANIAGTP